MNELINSPLLITVIGLFPLIIAFKKARPLFLRFFLPAEAIILFSGQLLKKVTAIPRPFWHQPQVLGVASNIPQDYSFPSLHAALATFFAWALSYFYPRLAWLWFGIMTGIAYSRVSLGLHYFTDVIAGFILGTICFWFFYFLSHNRRALQWGQDPNARRKLIHLFYGLLLVFLLEYRFLSPFNLLLWTIFLGLLSLNSAFLPRRIKNLILYFERQRETSFTYFERQRETGPAYFERQRETGPAYFERQRETGPAYFERQRETSSAQFEPQPSHRFLALGPLFFTLSSLLAVLIFSRPIALAAILNLAIGDSVNALIGSFWSPNPPRKKRLAASIAAYLVVVLATVQYLPLKVAALASLGTLALEFSDPRIKGRKIDDNLFIPLVSGILMTLLTP